MSISPARWFVALACLALLMSGAPTGDAWAATKKKPAKSWPSKKKHPQKKHAPAAGAAKGGGAATPAEDAGDDGDESAQGDDEAQDNKKPAGGEDAAKAKPKKVAKGDDKSDDDERDDRGKSDDDDGGDSTVVRKKARRVAEKDEDEAGAPIAFELMAGPRAVHRSFDFYDPLSDHQAVPKPFAYQLPAGPAPFVQLGLYPAGFATRGFAANFGLTGSFEKLVATKTNGDSTVGQQFDAGLRFRLPLGASEVGLTGAYGQHTFHVTSADPKPGDPGAIPNVDYKFARVAADARLRFADVIEVGFRLGTRLVLDTGSLGRTWFPNTKTNSIEAGLSFGYQVTPLIGVVAGADFLRYAFDFNPVPLTNAVVAGGAVDQYISGFLALRLSIAGG